MDKQFDISIIGGGVAGLTAAIYSSRAGMRVCVIENMFAGGQTAITSKIENYPGFVEIDGAELALKILAQAENCGATIVNETIEHVDMDTPSKVVRLASGEVIRSRAIIIATGAQARKLNIAREDELSGRGVSYCATCDGALYKNKDVAIVGGGNSAVEEAIYLSQFASRVTLIHRRAELRATRAEIDKLGGIANIELRLGYTVESLIGAKALEAIVIRNTTTGESHNINVRGIFVAIGRIPMTDGLSAALALDEGGYIITDEEMRTNIDGVYAIGDVRHKTLRQIVTAVADGAIAGNAASLDLRK